MKRFLAATILSLVVAEGGLRILTQTQPGYYTGFREPRNNAVYHFPYGDIRISHDGFPDEDFPEDNRPRVGWFGDSVAFGVGAGAGYRVSDLVGKQDPREVHRCFASIGDGFTDAGAERVKSLAARYRLQRVVYLMNLNDLLPTEPPPPRDEAKVKVLAWIRQTADRLRGRSYLYTYLRSAVADALLARGWGTHGLPAVEFFPRAQDTVLVATAERVKRAARELARAGTALVVVLLPYEMQISAAAAQHYSNLGVKWQPEFTARAPQRRLRELLAPLEVLDAAEAFPDPARAALGEFFVFDRGGRLDWNHPNRRGHAAIARWLIEKGVSKN
jgi:hypothetical protein